MSSPFSQVYVVNPDGTPARHVQLVFTPGDKEQKTMENGMSMFTINTMQKDTMLKITVSNSFFFLFISTG